MRRRIILRLLENRLIVERLQQKWLPPLLPGVDPAVEKVATQTLTAFPILIPSALENAFEHIAATSADARAGKARSRA
jgi:hypothetical protein